VALLDALGGGSLRTIYKHLETWQQNKPVAVKTEPNEIPPAVQLAFANAWRLAAQEAGREVQAAKEKAAEEVNAALRQFHGALEAIGKLEAESEADALEMESLRAKLEETAALVHAAQTEGAGHKATADQLQKQVEMQGKELERLRLEAGTAAELRGKAATLQEQNDRLMDRLGKLNLKN